MEPWEEYLDAQWRRDVKLAFALWCIRQKALRLDSELRKRAAKGAITPDRIRFE